MKSMMYTKPSSFFTPQEIQQFLKIDHDKTVIGDIVVYDFKSDGFKSKYSNPLLHVKLVEVTKPVDMFDDKYMQYLYESGYRKEPGLFIASPHAENIVKLINRLADFDKPAAQKMLERYQNEFTQSKEAAEYGSKVFKDTNLMMEYLDKANLKVKDLNIDIDALNKLGDNEDTLEKELNKITKNFPKSIKIPGYNDLDYYPFLFENLYLIEDVSSDRMLVCKKEGNKTSWHQVARHSDIEINDWISETLYDHHQLVKLQLGNLNEFNLIAEYEGDKLTKATIGIHYLNLLQGFIVGELVKKDKIKYDVPDLSFEDLVKNYAFQKEMWQIEERAITDLLQEIKIVDGKMTYDDFSEIAPDPIKKCIKHEELGEHHFRDLEDSDVDFSGLKKLDQRHRDSINEYLGKLLEKDNSEFANKLVDLIQNKFSSNRPKKKM